MRRRSFFVRSGSVCLFFALLTAFSFAQTDKITEGSLRVLGEKGALGGLCPLKNTEVKADISGFISRVTVTQYFQNPFAETIEAVYTFPLPNDAAVDDMTMQIGGRIIKGKIMERAKAQEIYDEAKKQGKTAALLQQQRPNIFTQAVANITPNAEIKVVISYVETLKYADDTYEFTFPMTIGERYIPASVDGADAAKISPESKMRPGHTVSIEVNVNAGVTLQNVSSNTHRIEADWFSAAQTKVRLKNEGEIPNRDFVLKYKTAGQKMEDAVLAYKNGNDGFFTLILQPPDKVFPADTTPKEIVFVLDTSGSMNGFPIEKAKEAMRLTLDNLNPNDTFNLITFAGETRILFDRPVPATRANLAKAQKLLNDVDSDGGTEMMKAIRAALEPTDSNFHVRIVSFMTDGQVGNEAEIIAEVQKHPNARVFGFGIGSSVNHYLLDEISLEGRGEVEYVGLNDDGSAAARRFYERIRNPLLTDISLEFQGIETADVLPQMIPDVFDAKPVAVIGRYASGGEGKIVLHGKMQGQIFNREIAVSFPEQSNENDVLATLWARKKIADLTRRDYAGQQKNEMDEKLQAAITSLGLRYKILTPFTSFVAVDEQPVTDGSETKTVEVPVALPENSPPGIVGARGVSAMVQVTADSSVSIDATDTKIDTNITKQVYFAQPPIKGNSFQLPLSIAGGVTQIADSRAKVQQGLVSSNGQRPTENNFSVDGIGANLGIGADETSLAENAGSLPTLTASGGTNSLSSAEMTQEVNVKTFSPVKNQRVAGAQINFISVGGTNSFHGSVFETFGNEFFNANEFFANSRRLERPSARLNQFGGTLSGYIVKDKAWFSGGYEGLRLRQQAFSVSEVPNLFSRRTAAPEIRPLLNAFPVANDVETTNGFAEFAASYTNPATHDIFAARLDVQPTSRIRMGGRFSFTDSDASLRGAGENFSLNTIRKTDTKTNTVSGFATFTPLSNVVIYGNAGYSRNRIGQKFSMDDFGGADISNTGNLFEFSDFQKYDFGGRNSAVAAGNSIATTIEQFYGNGEITYISNGHYVSVGGNMRRLSLDIGAQPLERSVLFAGVLQSLDGTASRIKEISRLLPQKPTLSNFSLFAQDDFRINNRLNITFGVRWDADTAPEITAVDFKNSSTQMPDSFKNFAPRVAASFDPFGDGKTAIRGGAGLFYNYGNSAASAGFVNSFPFAGGYFSKNTLFTHLPQTALKPLVAFDKDLKTPRTWQIFAEVEREIVRNTNISASYVGAFGRRLYLTRTFNETDPVFNFVRLTDNSAESNYHSLQTRFNQRISADFFLDVRYTFSKSTDNFSPDRLRENNFIDADLSRERGVSDFDARHQFVVYSSYNMPEFFENGWKNFLSKDWSVAAFAHARTALPIDVSYARTNIFGTTRFRPDLVGNAPLYTEIGGIKQINPNAFAIPDEFRQGTLGRNALRGFPFFQIDASLQRHFKFSNETNFSLEVRAFNLLNKTNFSNMNGNLGTIFSDGSFVQNSYFGRAVTTVGSEDFTPFYLYGGARTIQISAKFVF